MPDKCLSSGLGALLAFALILTISDEETEAEEIKLPPQLLTAWRWFLWTPAQSMASTVSCCFEGKGLETTMGP